MLRLVSCSILLALSASDDVKSRLLSPFGTPFITTGPAIRFDSPFSPGVQIPILRQEQTVNPDGSYNWFYHTGNGIAAQESGALTFQGSREPSTAAAGSYSYTSPEGIPIALSYTADENGFRPVGAHLPTPPPIPPAILKALAWQAAHPNS